MNGGWGVSRVCAGMNDWDLGCEDGGFWGCSRTPPFLAIRYSRSWRVVSHLLYEVRIMVSVGRVRCEERMLAFT